MSLMKREEADQRPGFGPSEESDVMRLVRESRKGLLRVLFSRAAQFTILILLQLGILVGVFYYLQEYLPHALLLHVIIMAAAALYIINGSFDPSPKLTWLLVVFLFPVSGVLLLVIVNTNLGNRRLKEEMQSIVDRTKCRIPQTQNTLNRMMEYEPEMLSLGGDALESALGEAVTDIPRDRNCGLHVVHMGGAYDSALVVPFVAE